jgi:hypothetical protein
MHHSEDTGPKQPMLIGSLLLALCASHSLTASSLSGKLRDQVETPIDGARIAVWEPGTGKQYQTTAVAAPSQTRHLAEKGQPAPVVRDRLRPLPAENTGHARAHPARIPLWRQKDPIANPTAVMPLKGVIFQRSHDKFSEGS